MTEGQTPLPADPVTRGLVEQSYAALSIGDVGRAAEIARAALERDPAEVPALAALAKALEAAGDARGAAIVYAEIVRRSPSEEDARIGLRRLWVAPLVALGFVAWIALAALRGLSRGFYQGTVLAGLLVTAVALLVAMLYIVRWRRRRFSSLSPADRRLLAASTGSLLRDPTAYALVISLGVIVLLGAAAILFATGTKPSLEMKVGDCIDLPGTTSIQQISSVPCELPHDREIYAVSTNPAAPGAPYPGEPAVQAAAFPDCEAAYAVFVGEPYSPRSRYSIRLLYPQQPYWDIGIRTTFCTIADPHRGQLTGSGRGAAR
jgi:Septum formation